MEKFTITFYRKIAPNSISFLTQHEFEYSEHKIMDLMDRVLENLAHLQKSFVIGDGLNKDWGTKVSSDHSWDNFYSNLTIRGTNKKKYKHGTFYHSFFDGSESTLLAMEKVYFLIMLPYLRELDNKKSK